MLALTGNIKLNYFTEKSCKSHVTIGCNFLVNLIKLHKNWSLNVKSMNVVEEIMY